MGVGRVSTHGRQSTHSLGYADGPAGGGSGSDRESALMTEPAPDITGLLKSWANGDENALQELMPLVYGELRRIAAYHMQAEKPDAVLEPTALVHEAYV